MHPLINQSVEWLFGPLFACLTGTSSFTNADFAELAGGQTDTWESMASPAFHSDQYQSDYTSGFPLGMSPCLKGHFKAAGWGQCWQILCEKRVTRPTETHPDMWLYSYTTGRSDKCLTVVLRQVPQMNIQGIWIGTTHFGNVLYMMHRPTVNS